MMNDGERDAAELEGEGSCGVCGGGAGPACGEECAEVLRRAGARALLRRHRDAARKALQLVRAYRAEGDGLGSPRLLATLARFGELRALMRVYAKQATS